MDLNLDEYLIEEVRKRPLLYDLGHEDYKDLKKKESAWKEISHKLKLDETLCKNRWKGLRNSYMRCKRTEEIFKKTASGFPKRKWRFRKNLSFLDNVKKSKFHSTDRSRTFQDIWLEICDGLDSNDDQEPAESYSVERLTPISQASESEFPVQKKKNCERKIGNFLESTRSNTLETCAAPVQKNQQNSTALLFESLAAKIREANMPMKISNEISAKVVALVFSEIQDYQDSFYDENE